MAFRDDQIDAMQAKLSRDAVKSRSQSGRSLSYIEGYHAIKEANRIFGFGEWDSEVTMLQPVIAPTHGEPNYKGSNGKQGYLVAYIAKVRVTVRMDDGATQTHEDVGYGEGIDYNNAGQAHESATKEAVTDAEKRALRHWGNPFGLALYDKDQREVDGQGEGGGNGKSAERRPAPSQNGNGTPTQATDAQRRALFAAAKKHDIEADDVRVLAWKATGKTSLTELTKAECSDLIDRISKAQTDNLLAVIKANEEAAMAAVGEGAAK